MTNIRFLNFLRFFKEHFGVFAVPIPIVFSLLSSKHLSTTNNLIVEMVTINHHIDPDNRYNLL